MSSSEFNLAKLKLEAFCAYQERCSFEVNRKLADFDLKESEVEALIKHLQAQKYLDDQRFAVAFASGKFNLKGWGKIKIRAHLRQKRIPDNLISIAFKEIDGDAYWEKLCSLGNRKKAELERETNEFIKKQKLSRFLALKGYESDLIFDFLSNSSD